MINIFAIMLLSKVDKNFAIKIVNKKNWGRGGMADASDLKSEGCKLV